MNRTPQQAWNLVIVLLFVAVIAGAAGALYVVNNSASAATARAAQLQRQLTTEERTARSSEASLQSQLTQVQSAVNGLNKPSDPLASYDAICNQQMTNTSTDLPQTYYFPCTNNVQTIPLPGN